ncbi:ABL105Wp [Eremothecium gossypii ATCC 10895]|uniref:Reticulon-like protein n=1 Tax=Eremothecium gossypii (strain ATCC 10895 / CBS 109.51 / FGSC 9923 / NRRL Y-1056) TaxID=284811 RepID=Q75DX8_EREGS|nr:ABL105Wp [Eremothecium gossypii ATCC 10895]AAS50666.1 ABL105Wp [Eremothecium gossypii ATCC 10895]AEY94954.1 FABL105Wp [Eremothecium gossypii FDAG1]
MGHCDLLLWRNPVETGKVFGGLLVALLVLKKVNLVTFFLRVLYTTLFLSSAVEFASKFVLGQGLVTKYGVQECPNVAGMLRPKLEAALARLPAYQTQVRRLVFAASPQQTFKAAGLLYVLHILVSFFSVWTLALLSVVGAFTLPVVYHKYQREIDDAVHQGLALAKAKSAEAQKMASETAAPYIKQIDEKFGPVSHYFIPKTPSSSGPAAQKPAAPSTASSSKGSVVEPSQGASSAASFPSVPSAKIPESATKEVEEEDIDIEQLKQEMKGNKEASAL